MKELIKIDSGNSFRIFTEAGEIEPILETIAKKARSLVANPDTPSGRVTIRKNAADVARTKTYIENEGKALADRQKEIPKLIDATRRKAREFMDALQEEVRQPLTNWENAEKSRVAALQARLLALTSLIELDGASLAEMEAKLASAIATEIDTSWQEYETEARNAKDFVIGKLKKTIAERREFERLKAEECKRIEAARIAEEKRLRDEAQARIEREKQEAVERARQEVLQAAERDKRLALEAQAREAEKSREDRNPQPASRDLMSYSERKHLAKIHRMVVSDLKEFASLTEEQASSVLVAIVNGRIGNVSIGYPPLEEIEF